MRALQWSLCTPRWEVRPSLTGWMRLRSPTSSPAKSSWRPDSRLHFFCIKTLKPARFDNWQMLQGNLISPLITVAQTQLFSSLTHISSEPGHWWGGRACNSSKKRKTWSWSRTCVICAYVCVCVCVSGHTDWSPEAAAHHRSGQHTDLVAQVSTRRLCPQHGCCSEAGSPVE